MEYRIPVKGTSKHVMVDSTKPSDELCAYIFQKGLEAILGRGRTKLGKKEDYANVEAYEAEALKIAQKQVEDLYEGKTRMVGAQKKAKGADAAVQTEMLRVAKIYAKEQVRALGKVKVSKVSAAEWTRAAKAYIEANSEYFRKVAEENLAKAQAIKAEVGAEVDLSFIKEDEKKVKAAAAASAKKKAEKEAVKAGKTAPPPPAKQTKGKPSPAMRQ